MLCCVVAVLCCGWCVPCCFKLRVVALWFVVLCFMCSGFVLGCVGRVLCRVVWSFFVVVLRCVVRYDVIS